MAKFTPPGVFDFSSPASWPDYVARFRRYRIASKLDKEGGEVQVCTLIYCMGAQAEKILDSFNLSAEDAKKFDVVIERLNAYFQPKVNLIHERAQFHMRSQKPDESMETYIRALYECSEHCKFGNREEAIRDRLVLGVRDQTLSEKLQLTEDLTLDKAQEIARQFETVKLQLSEQRHAQKDSVSAISSARVNTQNEKGHKSYKSGTRPNPKRRCSKCGFVHRGSTCPAEGQTCHKCKRKGHFQSVCRKTHTKPKHVDDVVHENAETRSCGRDSSVLFLGSVGSEESEPPWRETFQILNKSVSFKVDTGADVTVIPESVYKTLHPRPKLQCSDTILSSPGGQVKHLGQFIARSQNKGREVAFRVFVVKHNTDCLLSREAAVRLNLVQRIDMTEAKNLAFGQIGPPVKTDPVKIILKDDAEPYSISVPRRIPIPLLPKVERELKRMEEAGVIEKVSGPTDWCAPMVPVLKSNGDVRICVDLKKLNKAVKRERYTLPTFDDITHKLAGSKVYSKLDASSGFWQIPLDPESAKYTCFMTPMGRYVFKRLPFGINLAPEIFQHKMEELLGNCEGVVCYMDDVLVYGDSEQAHDRRLKNVLDRVVEAGLKLNESKCVFGKTSVEFLGHTISADGIRPDESKVKAIVDMKEPKDITELRRFLGMVNFLGRYVHNLADILRPLNDLLYHDTQWTWDTPQAEAFRKVKELLTNSQTLAFFDPGKETVVCADASSYGLGGVIYQITDGVLTPVAFCSRSLTDAEKRYAQIEKETLAVVYACEKFERYLVGLPSFKVVTDHRPLVPLVNKKDLIDTPLRCQRLLMRLMRYNVVAEYAPGKTLVVADTLSRAPLSVEESSTEGDVTAFVDSVRNSWSVTDQKLEYLAEATQADVQLKTVLEYIRFGWPMYKEDCKLSAREFYPLKDELSEFEGLVTRGSRIVIPWCEREDVLNRIHEGHLGIQKCRERANQSVWWPGMSTAIADRVSACQHCLREKPTQTREPLKTTPLPDRPFERLGVDLCDFEGQSYLVTMDYYSKYLDIVKLGLTSSKAVIAKLKDIFAVHGIPGVIVSDNGPQFASREFSEFSKDWNFIHITSSPGFPQANGEAESGVKIAKSILRQSDFHKALLIYRATPIPRLGFSPAELALGRRLRTTVPTLPCNLKQTLVDRDCVQKRDIKAKQYQRDYHDQHSRSLPELAPGDKVLIKDDGEKGWRRPGSVVSQCAPRSYVVATSQGELRRNRRHLRLQRSSDDVLVRETFERRSCAGAPVHDHEAGERRSREAMPVRDSVGPEKQLQTSIPEQLCPQAGHAVQHDNAKQAEQRGVIMTEVPDSGRPPDSEPATTRSGRPVVLPVRFR